MNLQERVTHYLKKAEPLFEDLQVHKPQEIDIDSVSAEFSKMAKSYHSDAKHFFEQGDHAQALAALEYAEGWLDAGKAIGIFK